MASVGPSSKPHQTSKSYEKAAQNLNNMQKSSHVPWSAFPTRPAPHSSSSNQPQRMQGDNIMKQNASIEMSNNITSHSTNQSQNSSNSSNYVRYLDPTQRPQEPDCSRFQYLDKRSRYKQERNQWMDHSGELRAVIAALDRYTRDLNKQLEDEKHDAKVATDRMQRLLETKDASMGRQFIDDNKPKDLFTMLLSNVKKVVKLGVTEHDDLNLSFDTESSRHILHRVAPILSQGITLEQLFQSKEPSERLKFMRYFLRSYVTYVLCDEILPPLRPNDLSEPRQADHWAETEVSKSIGQIEDELVKAESSHQQITQRDICTWRAMTVDILTRATATPTQNAQRAAENAARKMLLYFPKKEDPVLRRKLFELCQEAISLSQRLRQQRAQWHVCHPSDIKLANFKSWVEDVTGGVPGPAAIVEFNLSPALVKSGNIDGERYDTESCIEPAEVSYGTILETQDQKPRPAPPISSKSFNSSENDVFGRNRSLIKPGFPRNDSTLDNPAKAILESNEVGARNRKEIASGEHVQISGTETHGCSECSDSMPESSATSFRGSIAADDGPRIQRKPNMASIYGTSLEQNASNDMGSAKPEDFDLK